MSAFKVSYLFITSFIFLFLIKSSHSTILIKAGDNIHYSCQRNTYYISMDVVISEKPKIDILPFTLNLAAPEDLNFKCILDYTKEQINCLRSFSDSKDFITKGTYLQFPYPFPELEDIEWDYETFLQKIYRKVWTAEQDCGKDDVFDNTNPNYKRWDIEGIITSIENGNCKPASISEDSHSKYLFDMYISFKDSEIIDDSNIEFLQEILVPLLPRQEIEILEKTKTFERDFSYALCKANSDIKKDNTTKFLLNCEIPIGVNEIFNGVVKIGPFFDRVYIKQNKAMKLVSLFIDLKREYGEKQITYVSLLDKDQGIICPNQPLFTIDSKDSISMGIFYPETSKYTFTITGTLSNGYYVFKNGTTVELAETYKNINFQLKIDDNLLDSDENDQIVNCTLPIGSPYNIQNEAVIKCIGQKDKTVEQTNNVDITLNWNLKVNNNFKNIMISWPTQYDESNKKNIYLYQLTGLSIRQSNFACHSNNFDFYVYIYNLYHEPKISFDLPLSSPKNSYARCDLFDTTALKCSLNLKHKKLSKGSQVMLPERGSETEVFTSEGNRIIFTMNNFSKINNDHDFYVKLEEECGDYLVVGTLKDMGMSHKSSVVLYVIIIVVIALIIAGFIIYTIWKIKKRIERGEKLANSEEIKGGDKTVGAKTNI